MEAGVLPGGECSVWVRTDKSGVLLAFGTSFRRSHRVWAWGTRELGPVRGHQPRSHIAVLACTLTCRALSRMGDGFCLFNFNFAFCGIPKLFEIDHPLIG